MGYGLEKPKSHKSHHRWMRTVWGHNGRSCSSPVLLRAPLPTDFCCHCRIVRESLVDAEAF